MFITLLIVTFAIAVVVSFLVVYLFKKSVITILKRIVSEEITKAWWKYLSFAIYVVGISGGVRVWDLEKYITPHKDGNDALILTTERWTLEVYRTVIETAAGVAWLLLVFFIFALIAYVITRGMELRRGKQDS